MSMTCRLPARARTTGRSRVSNGNLGRFSLRPCRHGRVVSSLNIFVRIGDWSGSEMPVFQRSRENSMLQHPAAFASRRLQAPGRARTGSCPNRRPRAGSSSIGSGSCPVPDCRAFRRSRENSAFQDPGTFASRRNRAPDLMRTGSSLVRDPRSGLEAKSPSRRIAAPASLLARFRRPTRPTSGWAAGRRATEDGP